MYSQPFALANSMEAATSLNIQGDINMDALFITQRWTEQVLCARQWIWQVNSMKAATSLNIQGDINEDTMYITQRWTGIVG